MLMNVYFVYDIWFIYHYYLIHYYISYCKRKICQAKFSFFFEEGKYYVKQNLFLEMIQLVYFT